MYDASALRNSTRDVSSARKIDLIEAQNAHAIIDIQPLGSNMLYQSTIRAVNPVARTIEIDEVFPHGFHATHGALLKVTLRLMNNRRETFSTSLLRTNGQCYELAMPPNLTYNQRRESYRFRVAAMPPIDTEFRDNRDFYYSASVLDISLMGVRLQLNHQGDMAPGDQLKQLSFTLFKSEFCCAAVVRNVLRDVDGRTVIGAELINMPRLQQRALEKILAQLHRQHARQKTEQKIANANALH